MNPKKFEGKRPFPHFPLPYLVTQMQLHEVLLKICTP